MNRLGSFWRRRASLDERSATARKPGAGKGLLFVMALLLAWQTMTVSTRVLHRVALLAEQRDHPDVVMVKDYELARLERAVEAVETDGADGAALEMSDPRHAATAAFVVAAFSLTTGACSTLAAEGAALWFLYTAPQRLLLEKLWAWASVAALFALLVLLAFALWQKLRDQQPFLLNPSEAPPPSIGVADGVLAVLAFFVLRSLFTFLLERAGLAAARALLIGFVCAGGSVAVLALIFFYQRRVPEVLSALGLARRAGQPGGRLAQLGLGVGAGLVAASLAILYLTLVPHVPGLARPLQEAKLALEELDLDARLTLLALAVLAAPPFEELIFRGILYRGFRRSAGAPVAGLASALVFALMHPGVTAPPVFVMAWLAAFAYERTGWLLTPIATHVTYNAIVVGSTLL